MTTALSMGLAATICMADVIRQVGPRTRPPCGPVCVSNRVKGIKHEHVGCRPCSPVASLMQPKRPKHLTPAPSPPSHSQVEVHCGERGRVMAYIWNAYLSTHEEALMALKQENVTIIDQNTKVWVCGAAAQRMSTC